VRAPHRGLLLQRGLRRPELARGLFEGVRRRLELAAGVGELGVLAAEERDALLELLLQVPELALGGLDLLLRVERAAAGGVLLGLELAPQRSSLTKMPFFSRAARTSALRRSISATYSFRSALRVMRVFTSGLFRMLFARSAYSSVDSVSSMFTRAGLTVAMMLVFVRPPSESWSSRVSLLSRYGTCAAPSTSPLITRPSVSRLWLIMPASRARLSAAPERPMFSEPARSTRFILPTRSRSSPAGDASFVCTVSVKTECERELWSFIFVAAICRRCEPRESAPSASPMLRTPTSSSPWMNTPFLAESSKILSSVRGVSFVASGASRSRRSSLYSSM
jgi:hypothetical protein